MDIIRETIRLNQLENIVPVSKALGENSGTATFSLGERNSCNSLVERPGYNYPNHIEVPVITLDDYVRENNLEVGLIKVDIEGGEQLLLKGAVETSALSTRYFSSAFIIRQTISLRLSL